MLNFLNSSELYVSQTEGHDWKCNGFSPVKSDMGDGPFKTVEKALQMIYKMRSAGNFQPMTVNIIGDYYIEKPISFSNLGFACNIIEGQSPLYGISVVGYGDKKARFIGGKKLTLKADLFNGVDCFSASIPEIKSGEWEFSDLYVNGKPALRTRFPESGTLRALTTPTPEIAKEGEERDSSNWFIARKEDLESISGVENAIISFYHWWIDEHSPITSYDRESGHLEMKYYSRMKISAQYEKEHTSNLEYYLENIPQMFKNKGEWYFDRENGKVYYIPRDGETADSIEVFAPVTDKLFIISDFNGAPIDTISFENIEFLCSRGDLELKMEDNPDKYYASAIQSVYDAHGAIIFENAVNCKLESCRFFALGLHAVEIKEGCSSLRIEGCEFDNLGAGAIKILGSPDSEDTARQTHHIAICKNKISNCGKRYAAACGILACHTNYNEISENEICYLDYSGISLGWVWGYTDSTTYGNLVRKNHIHHIGMGRLSDMGGIYLLGRQRGTVLDGNIIHDVLSNHYGGNGIYADEGTSYITVINNIVYNCKSVAYNQHYGTYNVVKNNIFAFGGESVINTYTKDATNLAALFEQNVLITNGNPIYHFEPHNKYPSAGMNSSTNTVWDISGKAPVMYDNGSKAFSLEEWQSVFAKDEASVVCDPGFNDPQNGDFSVNELK